MNAAQQLETQEHFAALRLLLLTLRDDIKAAMDAARSARQPVQGDAHEFGGLKDEADKVRRDALYDAEIARVVQELQGVEDALTRLRDGTYGVCAHCGNKIPGARLRALPAAPCCADCQNPQGHQR